MSSKQPIVRQIAWISFFAQSIVLILLFLLLYFSGAPQPVLLAAILFLTLALLLRNVVPLSHRRGVVLLKNGKFSAAISQFHKSYRFFTRNRWIDRFRYLTLLSSSRISYREMALLNIAYCYGQMGNGLKSLEFYQHTLHAFPDSEMAKSSLKMFSSDKNIDQSSHHEQP